MDNLHYSHVTYDMPQEQLSYFDSRARSSQSTTPSINARFASERRDAPQQRNPPQQVEKRPQHRPDDDDDDEPKLAAPRGRLSDQYMQYFAAQKRDPVAQQNAPLVQKPAYEKKIADASSTSSRPVGRESGQETARPNNNAAGQQKPPARTAYQPAANARRVTTTTTSEASVHEVEDDEYYWSHNEPSATSQRSATNGPREPTIPLDSAARDGQRRTSVNEVPSSTSQNDYEQPRGDRQVPMRKSSVSRGTPMSRDSRSQRSDSMASADDSEAPLRVQQAYIPRRADVIPPVRQPTAQPPPPPQQQLRQQEQQTHAQERRPRTPVAKQQDEEVEKVRDEEENCTFHPQINNQPKRQNNNFHESPYRSSQGTNPPRDSRGDYDQAPYDKLYNDAEIARRTSESRRMQKTVDEAELEINEKYGVHATAINPRRLAVKKDVNQEEVFARLYADAQRYNREKAEQEKFLEMKRQEERGEAPYDWAKGKDHKDGATEEAAAGGEERSASKPRRSPSRQKPLKNMEVFERLARPTSVTLSYQKQKEMEEQEKQEKEMREQEQKKSEMEKIAGYDWGIPAKSFTFADLESQNAMYVS